MSAICPKCHDSGFHFEQSHSAEAVITTVKWCDCPATKRYLANIRAQIVPKMRASLVERDILERVAQLAAQRQQ